MQPQTPVSYPTADFIEFSGVLYIRYWCIKILGKPVWGLQGGNPHYLTYEVVILVLCPEDM
jgi:hypothetical protein